MTTALYSMAGLGSLEQSKTYRSINKEDRSPRQSSKGIRELKLDEEEEEEETKKSFDRSISVQSKLQSHLPDDMLALTANEIDILLVESDTIWMLDLPGTCVEIDPDAKSEEENQSESKKAEEPKNVSKFEKIESWSQTLDFSKKKKGAQCDDIVVNEATTQVSMKNFLDEEKKQRRMLESKSGMSRGSARGSSSRLESAFESGAYD